jgi:hypothetical protein
MQGLFGNIFGSQANQNNQASQGSIQNLPAQLGQGMWVTTTSNTSGMMAQQLQQLPPSPLTIRTSNGDCIDVAKEILLVQYILQRTVPNYDELVTQFKAIEDIKGAEQWDK